MRLSAAGGLGAASVLVLLALAGACGKNSPSQPSGPSATKLDLNVAAVVLVGKTAQATATVHYDDGTSSSTVPTFTGDNNAVATVSASGLVIAIKPGTLNVTAAASNLMTSQQVRVVPDIAGLWNGTATVTSCSSATLNCQANGATVTFSLNSGGADTTTSGFFIANGVTISVSGTVSTDGTISLSGSAPITDPSVDTIKVQSWTSTVTAPGVMSGSFTLLGQKNGATLITTTYSFTNLTRQ